MKSWFGSGDECLGIEELDGYLQGRADLDTRTRVETHLDRCPRCSAELSLLRRFEAAVPEANEVDAVSWITERLRERGPGMYGAVSAAEAKASHRRQTGTGGGRKFAGWWDVFFPAPRVVRWAVAAASLVVLAVALPLLLERSAIGPLPRIDTTGTVVRSGTVDIRAPRGDMAVVPERLEWEPVARAEHYNVVMLEVDRTEVWKGETVEPYIRIPTALRDLLVPGKTLLWQVTALDVTGREIGRSELTRFRIGPESGR